MPPHVAHTVPVAVVPPTHCLHSTSYATFPAPLHNVHRPLPLQYEHSTPAERAPLHVRHFALPAQPWHSFTIRVRQRPLPWQREHLPISG